MWRVTCARMFDAVSNVPPVRISQVGENAPGMSQTIPLPHSSRGNDSRPRRCGVRGWHFGDVGRVDDEFAAVRKHRFSLYMHLQRSKLVVHPGRASRMV